MKESVMFFALGLYVGVLLVLLLLVLICLLRIKRNSYRPLSQPPHDEDAIRRSIEIQKADTYNLYTLHELPNSKKYVVIDCKAGRGLYSRESARVIFEPRWSEIKFENGVFIITPMRPTGNGGPEGEN